MGYGSSAQSCALACATSNVVHMALRGFQVAPDGEGFESPADCVCIVAAAALQARDPIDCTRTFPYQDAQSKLTAEYRALYLATACGCKAEPSVRDVSGVEWTLATECLDNVLTSPPPPSNFGSKVD